MKYFESFRQKHPGLWQFLTFAFVGGFSSLLDLVIYVICYYLIFHNYTSMEFHRRFLHYDITNGGYAAFLSMFCSYIISSIVSFFLHREKTFHSKGKVTLSLILYIITILLTFIFALWLPTVIGKPVYHLLGPSWGALAVKLLVQLIPGIIQFPLFKWVIMR